MACTVREIMAALGAWNTSGKCILRLNKSLSGLKQASYNWFENMRSGFCSRGFVQSQVDPCVLFGDGCVVLTYVDDVIIMGSTIQGLTT